jgi:polyisoprenoid-binding protein YceI
MQAFAARPGLFERLLAIHQGRGSMGNLVSTSAMLGLAISRSMTRRRSMKVSGWKSATPTLSGTLALAIFFSATTAPPGQQPAAVATQEIVLGLDPAQTKVHWTVGSTAHTVHGTFALKSGSVYFDPESGKAGGEIVVFATSGDSGNSSRDAKMHKEVLESAKYPDVVFRSTKVEGNVARTGNSDVKLHGVSVLHGAEHELIVPVRAWRAVEGHDEIRGALHQVGIEGSE